MGGIMGRGYSPARHALNAEQGGPDPWRRIRYLNRLHVKQNELDDSWKWSKRNRVELFKYGSPSQQLSYLLDAG